MSRGYQSNSSHVCKSGKHKQAGPSTAETKTMSERERQQKDEVGSRKRDARRGYRSTASRTLPHPLLQLSSNIFLCLPALCFLSRIKPPSHRFSFFLVCSFLVLCLFLPPSIRLRAESRKTSSKEEDLERTKRRDQHITERGQNTIKHKHQRQRTTQARAGTRKDDKSIPWKL